MKIWLSTVLLLFTGLTQAAIKTVDLQPDNLFPRVRFETNFGNFVVELDRTRAPITVDNFLRYAVDGHYNKTLFHRIVKNFVVQGGGYDFKFNERPTRKAIVNESGNGLRNEVGTIAMAREDDPHSATSQFYFNLKDNKNLDPSPRRWGYAVFGEVVDGMDVLKKMGNVATETDPNTGFENVPTAPVMLNKVVLLPPIQ